MTRILIIDDEKLYQRMVAHAIEPLLFEIEYADDGELGVRAALKNPPDLIICDVMMPNLNGYDAVRRLRRDARFAHIPILILTAQADIHDKLMAFESGADDHVSKPFEPAELIARISVLLKRFELFKSIQAQTAELVEKKARVVAIHSLRGGLGCSSMALNLGLALMEKTASQVLVTDMVLTAGQIALMLNASLKRTWADIAAIDPTELDWDLMKSIITRHESGIHCIAAPTYPSEAETLTPALFSRAFDLLGSNFDTILVDLPHDFSGHTLEILDIASDIVMLLAPELASVRAAAAALDTYKKLGYADEKIHLVLNWTFDQKGLQRKKIENALNRSFELVMPFAPDLYLDAINQGQPFLLGKTPSKSSEAVRLFANQLYGNEKV